MTWGGGDWADGWGDRVTDGCVSLQPRTRWTEFSDQHAPGGSGRSGEQRRSSRGRAALDDEVTEHPVLSVFVLQTVPCPADLTPVTG